MSVKMRYYLMGYMSDSSVCYGSYYTNISPTFSVNFFVLFCLSIRLGLEGLTSFSVKLELAILLLLGHDEY
jgi:hypothetical protein